MFLRSTTAGYWGSASLVMLTTSTSTTHSTQQSFNDRAAKLASSGGLQYGLGPNSWSIYAMMINVLFTDC